MIEDVEAALGANPAEGWGVLVVCLLAGLAIDLLLHLIQRWAGHRGWRFFGVLVHALRGVPTTLGVTLGALAVIWLAGLPQEYVIPLARAAFIVLFVALAVAAVRLLTGLVRMVLHKDHATVSLVNLLIRVVGGLIVLALVLSVIGVPVAPLLTLLAGSSLGLSLALREPLSNLFAGLQIVASNRVRPGAYVRLASGEEGYIADVRWSDTTIRQLGNATVVVPNTVLTTALLTDYNPPDCELALVIPIGVHYRSDLRQVERVTLEVARAVTEEVAGAVKEFQPFLRFSELGDYAIKGSVILRVRSYVDQYLVRHEFIQRLHLRYAEEGIAIPFPIVTVAHDAAPEAPPPAAEEGSATPTLLTEASS